MSSICGVYYTDGRPAEQHEIAAMLDALAYWQEDRRGSWRDAGIGMGQLLLATTAEAMHEHLPRFDVRSGIAFTGDVRIDNRTELCGSFGIEGSAAKDWTDSSLVIRAYEKWGDACPAHLVGDFAFALWDRGRQRLFCARDRFGVKPFYYCHDRHRFAFASEIKGLRALNGVGRCANEQWIADFLHGLMIDRDATFYADVLRLEPAHTLTIGPDGLDRRRYWRLDAERETRFTREEDYVDAFREQLQRAITRRLRAPFVIGAELSGGLDSSAVCAIAHAQLQAQNRPLHVFSQVRAAAAGPELPEDARRAIESLCAHSGMPQPAFLTGEDAGMLATLEWAASHYDEPPRIVVGLYNDLLYDAAAARGVRVLLSGFGGNQGVSAIAAGVRHELLRSGRLAALWRELAVDRGPRSAIRGYLRFILENVLPIDAPFLAPVTRRTAFWKKFEYRALRGDAAIRLNVRARAIEHTRRYSRAPTLRQQVSRMLEAPDVALRLEYAHTSTTARRIEYRYPLLDADLVEFYLALPSHLKHAGGVGRYIMRLSIEGFVPDDVRWAAAARASANPGAVLRKRRDRGEMIARIQQIAPDNPVFAYVDLDRLMARPTINGQKHRWERDTELLNVLMLEQKLRNL